MSRTFLPTVGALAAIVGIVLTVTLPQRGGAQNLGAPQRSAVVAERLGVSRPSGMSATDYSLLVAQSVREHGLPGPPVRATAYESAPFSTGLGTSMAAGAPLSAAVITTIGGRGTQFDGVALLADWDGREDLTADHQGLVDDFSAKIPQPGEDFVLTRAAISEHTIANGFAENVFYYGDSFGNVYVAQSASYDPVAGGLSGSNILAINLPTVLNAFGTLQSDDQIVVTGLAVNPVADLTSFSNVNGSFNEFTGLTGEVLYVSFWDTGGGFRLASNGTIVRSGLVALPIADVVSGAVDAPSPLSDTGFPVTVGGAFGVLFSIYSNLGGIAVDDDGSIYFHQVDLVQLTGANIVKVTDTGTNQDRSAATNGFLSVTTLNPSNGLYGTASGPSAQVNRFTNYSGTSTTFGNVTALAAGPGNVLYAAVTRSLALDDDARTQDTEGLFSNPAALGATPSMIISFADATGAFEACTSISSVPPHARWSWVTRSVSCRRVPWKPTSERRPAPRTPTYSDRA